MVIFANAVVSGRPPAVWKGPGRHVRLSAKVAVRSERFSQDSDGGELERLVVTNEAPGS